MNKSAASKEALLEIARDISYREGISKTSIRRLTPESGVTIGTVHSYYPPKVGLVTEIMEDFWRNMFHESHSDTKSEDFLGSVEEIYRRFPVNLTVLERELPEDLPAMEKAEREKNRVIEQKHTQHMKAGMLWVSEKDGWVDTEMWTEELTSEMLMDFTFSNIVLVLSGDWGDYRYPLWVPGRLLYGATSG